jgi:hypothetical protein
LPLVELAYKRAAGRGRAVTYALVIETQMVMGIAAAAFCTVGMIVNKDFQVRVRSGLVSSSCRFLHTIQYAQGSGIQNTKKKQKFDPHRNG